MRGLMQDWPLLVPTLLDHAARYFADVEIVSRSVEGPIHRTTYAEAHERAGRLAGALARLGVAPGDRVATLAWNGYRHFELFMGVPGAGAVCHTVNPRLFDDELVYVLNHAEDRLVFVDLDLVPKLEGLADRLATVEGFVVLTDAAHMPEARLSNPLCYEALLAAEPGPAPWRRIDENEAAGLCYTSGTTGRPKGVLYSHRALVLHAFSQCVGDNMGVSNALSIMPVVPMFHVNAWGIPHAAPMCGARLVLPGPRLDGAALHELIEEVGVDIAAGVPTIWLGLLDYLDRSGDRLRRLKYLITGGAAMARATMERFEREHGVEIRHAWGMTEMTPVGTTGQIKRKHATQTFEARLDKKTSQGRALYGVEMRIVDGAGDERPRDGAASGHLQVRGPWVAARYYRDEGGPILDAEGWFDTGDIATLDADGYMRITDRAKDVIKSGGEWISSIALENAALGHPGVAEAGAIGLPHPRWGERPLLAIVPAEGARVSEAEILELLGGQFAKWQLPDAIVFVDALPHSATGKISKLRLRERFKDHVWPDAEGEAGGGSVEGRA